MKRVILLILTTLLCLSLCSCDSLLKKAKSAITGEEESELPKDYIATLENNEFTYEVYEDYIKLTKYIAREEDVAEVYIPEEIDGKPVTTIGSLCFHETDSDVVQVIIPSSVTTIEDSAFYYAEHLTSVRIPDSVTSIGPRAFAWCNSLESISFGSGVEEIPEYCFNHCASLTTLIIPSKITKIGSRAFSYCENLNELILPSNINEIGDRVFNGCATLEYVIVSNPEISIGKNVFEGSEKVVVIAAENSNGYNYCVENGLRWSISKDIEAVIVVPEEISIGTQESYGSNE